MTGSRPAALAGSTGSGFVLGVAGMAGALGSLDTMLNIAFPDLTDDFDLSVADLRWVVLFYVVAYAASLLVAGRLADRFGHRTILRWGAWGTAATMVGCGLAPGYPALLGARVAQGVATAAVMAAAPALVTLNAPPGQRGRQLGILQMCMAIGLTAGPVLGGPLVEAGGWRAVFWIRVPLAVVVAVAAARLPPPGVDGRPGGPLFDLALLRRPSFVVANLLNLVANGAMFATWLLVPNFLVDELGHPEWIGGLVLAASPALTAAVAPLAGRLSDRFGPAPVATFGLTLLAVALAGTSRLGLGTSALAVAAALALVGAGLGLFTVPNMSFVMGEVAEDQQGVAGALTFLMRTAGIVAGVNAASALFSAREDTAGFEAAFDYTFVVMAAVAAAAAAVSLLRLRLG